MSAAVDPKKLDQERIRGLLVKAGDDRKKVVGNIRGLVAVLGEDMAEHRETILLSFVECSKYLPTKSGVLATWLSLMNAGNRVFVSDCINSLYGELRYAVEKQDYQVSSCILRLLIELSNCGSLALESVVALCNSILDHPNDFTAHMILASCFWFQSDVALNNPDVVSLVDRAISVASSIVTTDAYLQRRDVVSPFPGLPDSLETLLNAIGCLRESGWTSQVLIQPVHEMRNQLPDTVNEHPALRHVLPSDDLSFFSSLSTASLGHRVHIPLTVETSLSASDLWLLEEILNNTIDSFQKSVGECSKALLRIPVLDSAFEAILAKTLISRSLQSPIYPKSLFRVFYHSTLLRCAMLQESLKPVVADVILTLVSEPSFTPESEILLAELVAFLMHNNVNISNLDAIATRNHRVVIKTIEQLTRSTSSAQAKLPEQLHGLLPSEPDQATFGITTDQFAQIKQVVRIKDGSEIEVNQYLRSMEMAPEETTRMFLMALIENGSRTITHFLKLVELYAPIVRARPGAREMLVDLLFQFWDPEKGHAQKLERYIAICLTQSLVDPITVAQRMDISNEDSVTCYRLIESVMKYAIQSSVAADVAEILLQKANDFMTKWIVKNWAPYIRPNSVELVKIF